MERKHYSDCAVHNAPCFSSGECDCGGIKEEDRDNGLIDWDMIFNVT